ncbi:MAG: DUF1559 domain-containing protein [Bythopirellula sp.]|nr:DUF1559 domain-containing protein [Bythopirellula sp.]
MNSSRGKKQVLSAFTLVELLVVIAIIGVLVALLLPAIQAAREAARRTQCKNQLRQMALAALNLESAHNVFPGGGIYSWPEIVQFSSGGKAFGPSKQGLSWAFQILPYIEQNGVHNLSTTAQIVDTPVAMYFCPSRRPPTRNPDPNNSNWLMDYAAINPVPTRGEVGDALFDAHVPTNAWCQSGYGFWGAKDYGSNGVIGVKTREELGTEYVDFNGVITRSSYFVKRGDLNAKPKLLGYPVVSAESISDGLSHTVMFAEKRINHTKYDEHKADDDRGWSDGWDIDTIRSGACPPRHDSALDTGPNTGYASVLTVGAAHPGGFHVALADASVISLNYDLNVEQLNQLAHRADGTTVNLPE